jgi:putative flippase GtrA
VARESTAAQFVQFAGVGAIGFVVDAAIFLALTGWYAEWHPYAARAVSASVSISTTWALNRRVTFRKQKSPDARSEYLRYVAAQVFGLILNLGVFAAGVAFVPLLRRVPLLALVLGAAVALAANFLTAKHLAFQGKAPEPGEDGALLARRHQQQADDQQERRDR